MIRLTVLMPVYNASAHLAEAMDSILNQTFPDFEFLIINDGSTDATSKLIEGYTDPRIRLISFERNWGIIQALNKGLEFCSGEYIVRMDADDIAMKDRLERQVTFMDAHPEIGVSGSAVEYFGVRNGVVKAPITHQEILWRMISGPPFFHPTVIFRKSLFLESGITGYPTAFPHAEDYGLWVELVHKTKFANLAYPLLKYRISSTSVSATNRAIQNNMGQQLKRMAYDKLSKHPIDDLNWEIISEESVGPMEAIKVFEIYEKMNQNASLFDQSEFDSRVRLLIKQLILKRGVSRSSLIWLLQQLPQDRSMLKYITLALFGKF